MAIDVKERIDVGFLLRWLSVGKLKEILDKLQDGDLLYPNRVGNISVVRNGEQIGYIDLASEDFEAT